MPPQLVASKVTSNAGNPCVPTLLEAVQVPRTDRAAVDGHHARKGFRDVVQRAHHPTPTTCQFQWLDSDRSNSRQRCPDFASISTSSRSADGSHLC